MTGVQTCALPISVEYVVFPDEGHGFSKKKNNMEANRKILEFLDKYLKGDGTRVGNGK